MQSRHSWNFLLVAALVYATGCVSQTRLDDLMSINRRLEEQKLDLQHQLDEAKTLIAALQANSTDKSELANALAQRDQLQTALEDAERRLRELSEATVALPPEVDSALKQLATVNPNLMTYDPQLGMVRFNSDLTFSLGSTEVNPEAASTLAKLADVVNSAAAGKYEVRVVGHTDNVPVRNPNNVQRYGDNWGLSAFRAIAVKDVLEGADVSPGRISIAGYGEFRPIVTNGPKGAEANRRVEIYLVKAALAGTMASQEPALQEAAVPVQGNEPADFK